MTVDLTLVGTPFSTTPTWTIEEFHQEVVNSITTATTDQRVLVGQINGSAPVSDVGPWWNQNSWWFWSGSVYVPAVIKLGNAFNQVTLTATVASPNKTQILQDKDGTIALTSDVFTGRGTVIPLIAATTTLLWSAGNSFSVPLDKNTTLVNSASQPGQEITIAIYNPAAWTVTYPSDVVWEGGTAPTTPAITETDIVIFRNVGGSIYGRLAINAAS